MQIPTSAVTGIPVPPQSVIVAHVAILSVALERTIEILKGILPVWPFAGAQASAGPTFAYRMRSAAMIVIAAAIGTIFCWVFHVNLLHVAHVRSGYIAVGLAAAAGAAFWNRLLNLMSASTARKEC
jgi:Carboxymuconolactone decarboxylase family